MPFREFITIMRARWRVITLSLLLVVGVAAAVTILTPPRYTATAKVYLATDAPSGADQSAYVITRQDLNTYVEVLKSPAFTDPLAEELDLTAGAGVSVEGEVSETSNILSLTATGSDPELVTRAANAAGPLLATVAKDFSPLLALNDQTVTAQDISPAVTPSDPVSPDPVRNIGLGVLLGLAIGIGLALLRQAVDTRVRRVEDVNAISPRPILGEVPLERQRRDDPLGVESDPHGGYAESIRRLRTNLLFVDVTTGGHTFVVTSSMPGEGKTTTTINLALAMAGAGSRVLLIDGDLRNPSVASTMGLEGGIGLTTILLGRAEPVDVIQKWGSSTLDVLAAGQIPPNPSELLGSEPMALLFDKLTRDYDFVLVDSPPIVPVIDAVLLNKLTNGLIMVVAGDRTRKRDLTSAVQSLETVEVPISGFVLNMVRTGGPNGNRYGGYYGYGHHARDAAKGTRGARKRSASSI